MELTRPLILGGIKHCGKTTLGRLIAQQCGVPFRDTDQVLEEMFAASGGCCITTREIFRELGEEKFRRLEAAAIMKLAQDGAVPRVIALGGGAVSNRFLEPGIWKRLGFTVYLAIRPELAFARVMRRGLPPFLAGEPDPFAAFCRLNREREDAYLKYADLVFPIEQELPAAETAGLLAGRIAEELKHYER